MRWTTTPCRLAFGAAFLAAVCSSALLPPDIQADEWTQVNISGFGSPTNTSALAMANFDGFLYVATTNHDLGSEVWKARVGTDLWREVTPGWTGVHSVEAMAVFGDRLYVGTDNGQIWQTSGEFTFNPCTPIKPHGCLPVRGFPLVTELWSHVTPTDPAWTRTEITSMAVFNGFLYVAKSSPLEVWRTANGTAWQQVVFNGFTFPLDNDSGVLGVYQDQIYVGTARAEAGENGPDLHGLQIWRSDDGVVWSPVVASNASGALLPGALLPGGFGFPGNGTARALTVFFDRLYVPTVNHLDGAQVWRFDGTRWENVSPPWSGILRAQSMAVFGNRLFVGEGISTRGVSVWATQNGEDWGLANDPSWGDPDHPPFFSVDAMTSSTNHLHAAMLNGGTGVQVWRKFQIFLDVGRFDLRCEVNPRLCGFFPGD